MADQFNQRGDAVALVTAALSSHPAGGVERTQAEIEQLWQDTVLILRGKSQKEVVFLLLTLATMNASLLHIATEGRDATPEQILQSVALKAQKE